MTIAAGFVCSDGILLASDTLYSGQVNRYGPKFWEFDRKDYCVVFGGAGTERGLVRTRDEIRERLQPGMSTQAVLRNIDGALLDVNTWLNPIPEERTYALVAIRAEGRDRLYHNDGGGSMLSVIDDNYQCVGYGASLGFYFARSLFRPSMPLRWAKVVAAQLVKQCKLHSGFCGGNTNIFEWPSTDGPRLIDDETEIRSLEEHLEVTDHVMRAILLDERANDDTLFERVTLLRAAVKDVEKKFFLKLEAAVVATSAATATLTVGPSPTEGQQDRSSPTLDPKDPPPLPE